MIYGAEEGLGRVDITIDPPGAPSVDHDPAGAALVTTSPAAATCPPARFPWLEVLLALGAGMLIGRWLFEGEDRGAPPGPFA